MKSFRHQRALGKEPSMAANTSLGVAETFDLATRRQVFAIVGVEQCEIYCAALWIGDLFRDENENHLAPVPIRLALSSDIGSYSLAGCRRWLVQLCQKLPNTQPHGPRSRLRQAFPRENLPMLASHRANSGAGECHDS
jgi:hypothetical protein